MKPSVAIVGCGKVGTALAGELQAAGYPLAGLSDTSREAIAAAAQLLEVQNISGAPASVTRSADIVFITTPDGAIAETCGEIARKGGLRPSAVVIHCSGALPSTVLSSANGSLVEPQVLENELFYAPKLHCDSPGRGSVSQTSSDWSE